MLATDQLELLTSAVDGELTPRQHRRLARLLEEVAEARVLYARLRADRDRLARLPCAVPPANLQARILARVAAHAPLATPKPVDRSWRQPSWLPLAVAASLLLGLTALSALFFAQDGDRSVRQPAIVQSAPLPASGSPPPTPGPKERPTQQPQHPQPGPPDNHVVQGTPPVEPTPGSVPPETLPNPRPVPRDLVTGPVLPPLPPVQKVEVRIPFLRALSDLEQPAQRGELAAEFGRDPAFRVDLFARDVPRGAELFQTVARSVGVKVYADAMAQSQMKQRLPVTFVIYTETLTAAELTDLFTKLAAADAKTPARAFADLHVTPAQTADARQLRDVLGFDPGLWKRIPPGPATPFPTSARTPIDAGTGDMVARALRNSAGKKAEKSAMLMTFTPNAARVHPAASKELRQFIEKRGERKPTAVPVLIVIRPGNG